MAKNYNQNNETNSTTKNSNERNNSTQSTSKNMDNKTSKNCDYSNSTKNCDR